MIRRSKDRNMHRLIWIPGQIIIIRVWKKMKMKEQHEIQIYKICASCDRENKMKYDGQTKVDVALFIASCLRDFGSRVIFLKVPRYFFVLLPLHWHVFFFFESLLYFSFLLFLFGLVIVCLFFKSSHICCPLIWKPQIHNKINYILISTIKCSQKRHKAELLYQLFWKIAGFCIFVSLSENNN